MPRLNCTFGEFLDIIRKHGFVLKSHDGGSHQRWRGVVGGKVRFVDVACHNLKDTPPLGTLQSMIRQTGLPKTLFRK